MGKVIAIIPARSGSKGLPHKNIKLLCGKPLIYYTIKTAIDSGIFDKVLVSTDNEKYARISQEFGAEVPFLRPSELAEDMSSSVDVILHCLQELKKRGEEYDTICLLQPTSPLRTVNNIQDAFKLFKTKKANSIISVCECEHSPLWINSLDDSLSMEHFIDNDIKNKPRQILEKFYRLNGAIYIIKKNCLFEQQDFLGKKSYAYIMSQKESIDIDNKIDFIIAETLMNMS